MKQFKKPLHEGKLIQRMILNEMDYYVPDMPDETMLGDEFDSDEALDHDYPSNEYDDLAYDNPIDDEMDYEDYNPNMDQGFEASIDIADDTEEEFYDEMSPDFFPESKKRVREGHGDTDNDPTTMGSMGGGDDHAGEARCPTCNKMLLGKFHPGQSDRTWYCPNCNKKSYSAWPNWGKNSYTSQPYYVIEKGRDSYDVYTKGPGGDKQDFVKSFKTQMTAEFWIDKQYSQRT